MRAELNPRACRVYRLEAGAEAEHHHPAAGPGPEVGSCLLNRKTAPQPVSPTTRVVSGSTWTRLTRL